MRLLFVLGFVYIVYLSISQTSAQEQETEKTFQYREAKFLYEIKCSKCHTLDRIFAEPKSHDEWRICVARMRTKSFFWITAEEGEQILSEILNTRDDAVGTFPHKKKYDDARLLFVDRCTQCHSVNRILMARKNRGEWVRTILKMREKSPDSILVDDIPILAEYLTERGEIMKDDHASEIMVTKCMICHQGGRILLARKSREEWEKTVSDMREHARKTLLEDWFLSTEFDIIVDLLVKTQGIESEGF